MNTVLIELSLFLLYPFEKASHGIEWLTGHNCFAQARVCARICASFSVFVILIAIMLGRIDIVLSHLLFLYFTVGLIKEATEFEKTTRDSTARNSLAVKVEFFAFRVFTLLINLRYLVRYLIGVHGDELQLIISLFVLLAVNFISCTPLPPGSKGFRDWLKSLSFKRMLPQGAT